MTIYRLYAENGHRAGFWVQHRSWNNICAQVQSIAGHSCGALPGRAPLHDNAAVLINPDEQLFPGHSSDSLPATG